MNHWFLVGRDVMWFLIAYSPITLSLAAKDGDPSLVVPAAVIQTVGILLLYSGVIR